MSTNKLIQTKLELLPTSPGCYIHKDKNGTIIYVGKAKNLLNEKEPNAYKLGTPEFLGEVENFGIKLKEKFVYKIKNRTFQIGYDIQ